MVRRRRPHPPREKTHHIPVESDAPGDTPPAQAQEKPPPAAESLSPTGTEVVDRTYEQAIDHLQRLQAEFTNYRRRVEKERLEAVPFAQGLLAEKLLPVLDDFDRALAQVEDDGSPAAEGLALIRDKLVAVLADAGLERIETVDRSFDPEIHEALITEPVDEGRAGKVIEEFVPGFTFKGRLIRPARVKVGVEHDDA
jgi:molecular chaperone GrpE